MSARLAYSLRDAANTVGVSENFLRRAVKSLGREGEPPHLPAKNLGGRAGYRIAHSDLLAWFERLPDA